MAKKMTEIVVAESAPVATAPPTTVTPMATASVANGPTHCPYRRAIDLLQRLAPGKMRIGFFIGAG